MLRRSSHLRVERIASSRLIFFCSISFRARYLRVRDNADLEDLRDTFEKKMARQAVIDKGAFLGLFCEGKLQRRQI